MKDNKKKKAQEFSKFWNGKGYEKGESQTFWNMLLRDIFDIEKPEAFIEYEDQVALDKSTGFIDAYIPSSKVMIALSLSPAAIAEAISCSLLYIASSAPSRFTAFLEAAFFPPAVTGFGAENSWST